MIVNSDQLEASAAMCKRPRVIPGAGVTVSASQLRTAARLLREADPCVITSPVSHRSEAERPGFIEPEQQDDPKVLTFALGILPQTLYRIDRRGRVVSEHDG